jgi:hypothetical protein
MMTRLRSCLLLTVALATPAAAADFQLTAVSAAAVFGNQASLVADGLTLAATAWSSTGNKGSFEMAQLSVDGTAGMGVCSRVEGLGCLDSAAALDNAGSRDLLVFSFSAPVTLGSLSLTQSGADSDLRIWAGTGSLALAGLTPAALGTTVFNFNTKSIAPVRTVDLSQFTGVYDWLAVSANINKQVDDFARLRTLSVQSATPVPEPRTWMMLLAGLGLIGCAVRRRA